MGIDMRSKNPMSLLLEQDDVGELKAENIIARLWRGMLKSFKVSPMEWRQRVESYLDNPEDGYKLTGKSRSTRKGNVDKNAAKPKLTWKFLRRALLVIGIDVATLELKLTHQWGETIHDLDGVCSTNDSGKSLAKFFVDILEDLEVGPKLWTILMETTLDDPSLGLPAKGNERNEARSALKGALLNQSMSWKFFQQGLVFLGVYELEITLLVTRDGVTSEHKLSAQVQDPETHQRLFKAQEEKYEARFGKSVAKTGKS